MGKSMENAELRMENYRNKMLRILGKTAAEDRYKTRFCLSKRVQ